MKCIIPKCYFDKAKQMYPSEESKTRLMDIAMMLRIIANSHYGKLPCDLNLLATPILIFKHNQYEI